MNNLDSIYVFITNSINDHSGYRFHQKQTNKFVYQKWEKDNPLWSYRYVMPEKVRKLIESASETDANPFSDSTVWPDDLKKHLCIAYIVYNFRNEEIDLDVLNNLGIETGDNVAYIFNTIYNKDDNIENILQEYYKNIINKSQSASDNDISEVIESVLDHIRNNRITEITIYQYSDKYFAIEDVSGSEKRRKDNVISELHLIKHAIIKRIEKRNYVLDPNAKIYFFLHGSTWGCDFKYYEEIASNMIIKPFHHTSDYYEYLFLREKIDEHSFKHCLIIKSDIESLFENIENEINLTLYEIEYLKNKLLNVSIDISNYSNVIDKLIDISSLSAADMAMIIKLRRELKNLL